MQKTYILKNLECANCGGKIEEAINALNDVEKAVLNFPERKLKVTGNINSDTEKSMQDICDRIENGVIISSGEEHHHHEHNKLGIISLAVGTVLFICALIISDFAESNYFSLILYLLSYLILGYKIIISAFKNIFRGNLFDENFLMTIATVGAICLGEYSEAVGVVLFFNIGSLFEHYAVEKSRKEISSAVDLKVEKSEVLRDGEFISIDSDEIKIGDIIRVRTGERISVDGIVKSGETLLDTSAINGEPMPISVKSGDKVISGYINTKSAIEIEATETAKNSMLSKIAEAIENASDSKPKIDRFITRFSKVYTPIVIALAVFTAIVPSLITGNWNYWIYTALTFLVISCPCALVLSVPLAYFSGIGKASKNGILFKGGNSLEMLNKIKAVAFDKTGTVTKGIFTVTECRPYGEFSEMELLSLCGSVESMSSHPVAVSIANYCREKNITLSEVANAEEIAGMGIKTDNILCGNEKLMNKYGISVDIKPEHSGSVVYTAYNNKLCGYVLVSDSVKENSAKAVKSFKDMGIKTFMLTGDKAQNAEMTADKVGIDNVYSELLPSEKLEKVQEIREKFGNVMFIGDGINDAPVLAGADVGGAMQNGSDLALESADVIFMKSDLQSAVIAKEIADKTAVITKQNIIFALAIKFAVLVLGLFGIANMWFAVFADSGTAMLLVLNSIRILFSKNNK
ncbi:MAG: heavy metal translocating P-type ATPase [Oscillospiraceae bacterium]|nr:heavy metal translocating P-type ATPase [Oscillospiraceae bacterium]